MSNTVPKIGANKIKASGQVILTAAKELFWKWGIRKVSVAEICQHAGVSKMTFYRHFENKDEVALQVMDRWMEEGQERFQAIMMQETVFSSKMKELIALKHEQSLGISEEFLRDITSKSDTRFASMLEAHSVKSEESLLLHFRQAQKDGYIRKDLNLTFLFFMMRQTAIHLRDESFFKLFPNPGEALVELTKMFVYGIQPMEGGE